MIAIDAVKLPAAQAAILETDDRNCMGMDRSDRASR
jgi:hypothetical protein